MRMVFGILKMDSDMPVKKHLISPFLASLQKGKRTTKVHFESLPKPSIYPRFANNDKGRAQQEGSTIKPVTRLRAVNKELPRPLPNEEDDNFKSMAPINIHLDLPLEDDDYDLDYTPYEYDSYGPRPQTSYMSIPFASRSRALESIAECRTPSPSASSGDNDITANHNQILNVKRIKNIPRSEEEIVKLEQVYDSKSITLPKIQQKHTNVVPVKVKPVQSLNDRLPDISNAFQRLESTETFLAHSRLMNQSRSDSVESILRTPSTSRHLLWSRGSALSDGGFYKNRSDTSITRVSQQSEPTPTLQSDLPNSDKQRKKARKHRRKPATKFYVPYQSFMDSVIGNKKGSDQTNAKSYIKSSKFTLFFPSIQKKCTISPIRKEGKWFSK